MTKTKQATKSAKPAPVELHDEALDAAAGGLLLPAVQKVPEAAYRLDGMR